jgi:hypothetical protein
MNNRIGSKEIELPDFFDGKDSGNGEIFIVCILLCEYAIYVYNINTYTVETTLYYYVNMFFFNYYRC